VQLANHRKAHILIHEVVETIDQGPHLRVAADQLERGAADRFVDLLADIYHSANTAAVFRPNDKFTFQLIPWSA
jgi:hypothetical protein